MTIKLTLVKLHYVDFCKKNVYNENAKCEMLKDDEMTAITTRSEERLSLVRRADEWKNSIIEETPNKLLEFVGSVQQMLMVKLDRIEHKIKLKMTAKKVEQEISSEKYQKNEITSSLVGLKTSVEQSTVPTALGNATTKNLNRARS